MTLRICGRDVRRVLDAVALLHDCDDVAMFPTAMRSAVGSLVSGEVVAYSELDLTQLAAPPPEEDELDAVARLNEVSPLVRTNDRRVDRQVAPLVPWLVRFAEDHPLLHLALREPDPPVAKVSDFLTLPQFQNRGLYRQFFGPLRLTRQIAVCPTKCAGIVTGVTVNRSGRDFSERDKNCLTLLSPHLREAFRATALKAQLLSRLAEQQQTLENVPAAILMLTEDCRKVHCETALARDVMLQCFPKWDGANLPDPVVRWLAEMLRRSGHIEHPGAANQSLAIRTPGGLLRIKQVQSPGGVYLLLNLENRESVIRRLAELGLTKREAEVLDCLREGGTNRQIAARLHVSAGTVRTHVERILSKLGVPTRTAAVRLAEEHLSS